MSEDSNFCLPLETKGTNIFADTRTPTSQELAECPHIKFTSHHPWDPHRVEFPTTTCSVQEEVEMQRTRNVGAIGSEITHNLEKPPMTGRYESISFDIGNIATRIIANARVTEIPSRQISQIEVQDVPSERTFVSTERHTDVSAEDLSERWDIGLGQTIKTLKRTTQKFVRLAVMPLAR